MLLLEGFRVHCGFFFSRKMTNCLVWKSREVFGPTVNSKYPDAPPLYAHIDVKFQVIDDTKAVPVCFQGDNVHTFAHSGVRIGVRCACTMYMFAYGRPFDEVVPRPAPSKMQVHRPPHEHEYVLDAPYWIIIVYPDNHIELAERRALNKFHMQHNAYIREQVQQRAAQSRPDAPNFFE